MNKITVPCPHSGVQAVHETVDFVHNVLGKSIVQQVWSWPTITYPAISVLVLSLILLSYTCH